MSSRNWARGSWPARRQTAPSRVGVDLDHDAVGTDGDAAERQRRTSQPAPVAWLGRR